MTDSRYALLVSEALLEHGTLALDRNLHGDAGRQPGAPAMAWQTEAGWDRHLEILPPTSDGTRRIYYWYPSGSSVLSVPFVWLLHQSGLRTTDSQGVYQPELEAAMQLRLAAWLTAAIVAFTFLALRCLLPLWPALGLAIALGVSTPLWSTSSRAVWSSTWALALLAVLIWHLVHVEIRKVRLQPEWTATLCAWMWFCRPTFALQAAAVAVWVLWRQRAQLPRLALAGGVWLALFLERSHAHTGHWLPSYYRHASPRLSTFVGGFYGVMASPSRGLLVYSPALLAGLVLLYRTRGRWPMPSLVWVALAISAGHLLFLGAYPNWWGGHSYGARLSVDILPWLALACGAGLSAWLTTRDRKKDTGRMGLVITLALTILGVWMHQRGTYERDAWRWNTRPLDVETDQKRLWDWRYPQFLAGLIPWPLPEPMPRLALGQVVRVGQPEGAPWLLEGWGDAEGAFRWNETKLPRLCWQGQRADSPTTVTQDLVLSMRPNLELRPSRPGPRIQRVRLWLDDEPAGDWTLDRPGMHALRVPIPAGNVAQPHVLRLELPDGVAPSSLNDGTDTRPLAIALHQFKLEPHKAP